MIVTLRRRNKPPIARSKVRVFRRDSPPTRSRRSTGCGGGELQHADKCGGECSTRKNAFVTELETSARTESKRMTNHNSPKLSRMDLANHFAAFPGLSLLNTRAVMTYDRTWEENGRGGCCLVGVPPGDLLCTEPGSRMTCFTSVAIGRSSRLFHANDSSQRNGVVFLSACHGPFLELE
jgi:hypothetical protein